MADINTATFSGNITRDIEVKYTQNGTAVAEVTVACNTGFGDKKKTAFLGVTLWGVMAQNASKHLGRGSKVGVTGEIIQDRWETDGKKQTKTKFRAINLVYLGSRPNSDQSPAASRDPAPPQSEPYTDADDQNVPF